MKKKEITRRINEITSNFDFIYIISLIVLRDFSGTLEEISSKDPQERLNYNELKFLMGLWIKNCNLQQVKNYDNEIEVLEEVYMLMEELHYTFLPKLNNDTIIPNSPYDLFDNGLLFQEAMFYSSTGAYDYQYTKWVADKYKYDKKWLQESKSINIDILADFYKTIKNLQQKKLNKLYLDSETNKVKLLDVFTLTSEDILRKNKEFSKILENFILDLDQPQNQNFTDIGDFNILSEKPIIKLPNGNLFIPVPFYLSEAIYESPFYWMNSDKKYSSKALHNRGESAEEITLKIVEKVFGKSNTLKNVIIKKNKSTTVTDIDILAFKNNKAIIFQVKSKKITALSKKGNIISIKNDFKKAVEDAYTQGLIALECLKNNEYTFELKGNPDYNFDLKIERGFIVTIVLDTYPAITHQTHILLGREYEHFPVALNIFNLEIIAKYLNSADKFIDYIERRIKYSKYFKAENELVFLGYHLKNKLQKVPHSNIALLDNQWAQCFDTSYYREISETKKVKNNRGKKL